MNYHFGHLEIGNTSIKPSSIVPISLCARSKMLTFGRYGLGSRAFSGVLCIFICIWLLLNPLGILSGRCSPRLELWHDTVRSRRDLVSIHEHPRGHWCVTEQLKSVSFTLMISMPLNAGRHVHFTSNTGLTLSKGYKEALRICACSNIEQSQLGPT